MIVQAKTTTPFITFGFGMAAITVAASQTIKVWMETYYNSEDTAVQIFTTAADLIHTVTVNEYDLTYNTPGVYDIYIEVYINIDGIVTLTSNTITITVV